MSEPNFTRVKAYSRIADLANAIRAITRLGNTETTIRAYAEEILMQCDIIRKEDKHEQTERRLQWSASQEEGGNIHF